MIPRFLGWQNRGAIDQGKKLRKKTKFGGRAELEVLVTTLR